MKKMRPSRSKSRRESWPQPTIKALFGRAANRCSLCKTSVTELPKKDGDGISVIGEIAHIHALSSDGPRGKSKLTTEEKNDFDNLILVCANCHKKIDKQVITYTVEELRRRKKEHESENDRLTSVLSFEKAMSLLDDYSKEFQYAYSDEVEKFVPGKYQIDKDFFSIKDAAFHEIVKRDLVIVGASGLGKSLLAKYIGLKCLEWNEIPIFVEAIRFTKMTDPDDMLAGVSTIKFDAVASACAIQNKRILLIIDGYNECSEDARVKLDLWIIACVSKKNYRVVVTSQRRMETLQSLAWSTLLVIEPDDVIKRKIAALVDGDIDIDSVKPILDVVSTALEARLIGEVAKILPPRASRYAVFDHYARKVIGATPGPAIRALSLVAKHLYERTTFSLSIRELGRLLDDNQIVLEDKSLFKSRLFTQRVDRVFFGHELFFNAFSAEAVVRDANGEPNEIINALSLPRHREQRALILGAIDDNNLLSLVLPRIEDFTLLTECGLGHCGGYAKNWFDNAIDRVIAKVKTESSKTLFKLTSDVYSAVDLDEANYKWTPQESCLVSSLSLLLLRGEKVDDVFSIFKLIDQRIDEEFRRLWPSAKEKGIRAIRGPMFAVSFVGILREKLPSANIMSYFVSGIWDWERQPPTLLYEAIEQRIHQPDLSHGQLYLIIHILYKLSWKHDEWKALLVNFFPSLLKSERWKRYPYHLRLEILESTPGHWQVSPEQKKEIVAGLESVLKLSEADIIMPTLIIEALQGIGALNEDEEAHEKAARNELRTTLNGDETPEKCREAYQFFNSSFDHPFSSAYWNVVSTLSEDEKRKFYVMALKGVPERMKDSLFVSIALSRVAQLDDPSLSEIIRRFCEVPSTQDVTMPQEALSNFLLAHIALGWLGVEIRSQLSRGDTEYNAIVAYSEILYWSNRRDLIDQARADGMDDAWRVLLDHKSGRSLDALRSYSRISRESIGHFTKPRNAVSSIANIFPNEVLEICRQALINPDIQKGYFRMTSQGELLIHAIGLIGGLGALVDIPLLRQFTSDSILGRHAIDAIEEIEARLS
jgi:5-methylcytosine-specific restriction endonuclease McrA